MADKKKLRSTKAQLTYLANYMAAHPRLAKGEFNGPQGKVEKAEHWEKLRTVLKEYGPDKSIPQWEHTWRDMRRKAREDGARASTVIKAIGNQSIIPTLWENSIKILGTIGTSAFGISGAEESKIGPIQQNWTEQQQQQQQQPVIDVADAAEIVRSASPEPEPLVIFIEDVAAETPTISTQAHPRTSTQIELPRPSAVAQRCRTGLATRAAQFLEAEEETNRVLETISNELAIANGLRAIQARMAYRETLWRLRRKPFSFD